MALAAGVDLPNLGRWVMPNEPLFLSPREEGLEGVEEWEIEGLSAAALVEELYLHFRKYPCKIQRTDTK
jgi:hypothetical protein